jgi:ADP-heptose:LPS heptosyltransferase
MKNSRFLRKFEEYITLILSFFVSVIFYRKKRLNSSEIHRIAVIKLDHIGDVILSIPALASLRASFPTAHISIVLNPSSRAVAELIAYIDEILCYNPRFFDRTGTSKMFDFTGGINFARSMRRLRFDLIVELRGSFASLFYALIGNASYRIDRGTYLVNRKLGKIEAPPEHEALINLGILNRAGINTEPEKLPLALSREDIEIANSLLSKCYESNSFIIAVHPGGPNRLKRWDTGMYIKLIGQLINEYNACIVLVGGKGDQDAVEDIIASVSERVLNVSGQTTPGQLAAILHKVVLFIGNDSGPMHLAAACGTKVIGLFGPTSPQRFGPYGERCISIRMEKDCPPCMQDNCKKNYRCIDKISVEDVMKAVSKFQ